jgi:hypothetical protein
MEARMKQLTLDARIAAALADGKIAADDLQQLLPQIEAAIEDADRQAKQERERALDPSVSPSDAQETAQRASVAELKRDRLKAALPRLREKLAEALRADYCDKWKADACKVTAQVAAATAKLKDLTVIYADLANKLTASLREAQALNQDVARLNAASPDSVKVDQLIDGVDTSSWEGLALPNVCDGGLLWPPPQPRKPSLAESYSQMTGMVTPAHPGADWASPEWQARRAEEAQKHREQMDRYYAEQTKLQQERINAEERARFAQSQQR